MNLKEKFPRNILPCTDEVFIALSLPLLRCFFTERANIESQKSIFGFLIWIAAVYFMVIASRQFSNSLYRSGILDKIKHNYSWMICVFAENIFLILYCAYAILMIKNFAGNYFDVDLYIITAGAAFLKLFFDYVYKFSTRLAMNIKNNIRK